MDLYIIQPPTGAPFFRGTQADAKSAARDFGGTWNPIVVPDRKEDRITWLNGFAGGLVRQHTPCSHAIPAHVGSPVPCHEKAEPIPVSAAERVLSTMDAPGINVDQIVETILNAKGYALGRFAKAVSVRFERMGG